MEALVGFKRGQFRVLVATDIAARGIDVEALDLVVNFDVPHLPEDYIHRVGRTARVAATGEAYTLVSPDEEGNLRAIERHLGKPLPRHQVPGFNYARRPAERLEIPLAERIAAIRARRGEARATRSPRGASAARGPHGPAQGNSSGTSRQRLAGPDRVGAGLAWLREVTERSDQGSAPGHVRRTRRRGPAFGRKPGFPR
jgi:ATP-dependent RNA helicase RhlE